MKRKLLICTLLAGVLALAVSSAALAGNGKGHDNDKQHQTSGKSDDHGKKNDDRGDKGRGDDRDHHAKGDDDHHGHHGKSHDEGCDNDDNDNPCPPTSGGHKPPKGGGGSTTSTASTPVVISAGASYHCNGNGNVVVVGAGVPTALPFATFMFGDLSGPQPAQAAAGKTPAGSFTCSAPPTCKPIIGHDGKQMIADTLGDLFDVSLYGPTASNGETIGNPACSSKSLNFDPPGWHT